MLALTEQRARFDVAVARGRLGGTNAERDEARVLRRFFHRTREHAAKLLGWLDHLIGGQHDLHRARLTPFDLGCGPGHAGRGVAPERFAQHVLGRQSAQVLLHQRRVHGARDDEDAFARHESAQTRGGLRDQGALARDRQELFGQRLAAGRPEARAGAARHDHGVADGSGHGRTVYASAHRRAEPDQKRSGSGVNSGSGSARRRLVLPNSQENGFFKITKGRAMSPRIATESSSFWIE